MTLRQIFSWSAGTTYVVLLFGTAVQSAADSEPFPGVALIASPFIALLLGLAITGIAAIVLELEGGEA